MRDIKFRAWDKKLNVMWQPISFIKLLRYLFFQSMPNSTAYAEIKSHFDDIVWLEYIELKDRTGHEIYEGDVVHGFETMGGETVSYEVKYDPRDDYTWGFPTGLCNQCEIIGNIYENDDLLKKKIND